MKRLLFIPDTHAPYHDEPSVQLMLRFARDWKPHTIVILGDFLDCYSVSFHSKDPSRVSQLRTEVQIAENVLDRVDGLRAKEKVYVMGNHEYRLDRYIQAHAPALNGMVTVDRALSLTKRGWKVVPYMAHTKIGKLYVTHECGNAGPQAHIKAMKTFGGNCIIGHTHRSSIHYEGNARGEQHVGAMVGWLGNVEHVDYLHRVRSAAWINGWGVGEMLDNGNVKLDALPIVAGAVTYQGRTIRASA